MTAAALYGVLDYVRNIAALRPRGRAWPGDQTSVQVQTIGAWAPTAERIDAAAQQLLIDARPDTTQALLAEWEASLGLAGDAGLSTAARQAAIVAQLVAVGAQSKAYFIAYAAKLGFAITISTFAPFRSGRNTCGQPLQGPIWVFAWGAHVVSNSGSMTNAELLTALQAVAPAETIIFLD